MRYENWVALRYNTTLSITTNVLILASSIWKFHPLRLLLYFCRFFAPMIWWKMASNQKSTRKNDMTSPDGHFRCGYPAYNMNKYEARYVCLWCSFLIKEPYQLTECGHRVCRGCFESRAATMVEDEERPCPDSTCESPFRKNQVRAIIGIGWMISSTDWIDGFLVS